jgi:hypothetical protein
MRDEKAYWNERIGQARKVRNRTLGGLGFDTIEHEKAR